MSKPAKPKRSTRLPSAAAIVAATAQRPRACGVIRVDPDAVYLLDGAAALLQLNARAIRDAATAGRLPGAKVFGRWHFPGKAMLDWFSAEARRQAEARRAGEPVDGQPDQD